MKVDLLPPQSDAVRVHVEFYVVTKTYSATRSSKLASASAFDSMPLLIHAVIGFTMVALLLM